MPCPHKQTDHEAIHSDRVASTTPQDAYVYGHLTHAGGTLATVNQRCIGSWAEDQTCPASISYASDAICMSCKVLQIARDRNLIW